MSQAPDQEALAEAAEAMDVPPEELDAVLADVAAALEDVVDMEIESAADLDRVRESLPTEPTRAELLAAALPPLVRDALEYVHPSDRQSGYWRRSRERRDPSALSDEEIKQRWAFSQHAMDVRGAEGTVRTRDGREIPETAARVGARLEGEDFEAEGADADARDNGLAILRRIRELV